MIRENRKSARFRLTDDGLHLLARLSRDGHHAVEVLVDEQSHEHLEGRAAGMSLALGLERRQVDYVESFESFGIGAVSVDAVLGVVVVLVVLVLGGAGRVLVHRGVRSRRQIQSDGALFSRERA